MCKRRLRTGSGPVPASFLQDFLGDLTQKNVAIALHLRASSDIDSGRCGTWQCGKKQESAVTGATDEQGSTMGLKGYLKRSAFAAMAAAALSRVDRRRGAGDEWRGDKGVVSSGGTATMALDENLAGFNINTSAASEFVLQEIMNMVWPQAFIVNNKLQPVLNDQLLESAVQSRAPAPRPSSTSSTPRPCGPTARRSRRTTSSTTGRPRAATRPTPTSAGSPTTTRRPPATTRSSPSSGSDPSGGAACAPGQHGRPQRRPVPERPHRHRDLQAVLRRLAQPLQPNIVPAHIARTVGWNTGFTGPTQTISGSWYKIQSYNDEPVAGPRSATPPTGARPASSTRSSSSSSRTTASWCRPCRTRRSTSSTRRR